MVYRAASRALALAAVLAWGRAAPAQTWSPELQELWKTGEKQGQMPKDEDPRSSRPTTWLGGPA